MTSLAELYEYLENKRDDEHIDNVYSYEVFSPEEWPKARLEILAWWKVERLAEDENCSIDKDFSIAYLDERANATNNLLLKYRYNYFAHLMTTNDNRFAQRAVDALIGVIENLLPDDKEDYPSHADEAIEILMSLVKSVKYKKKEATELIWNILDSDYGYRTKLVCIRAAKEQAFFPASDAEKIACLCKELHPLTKDGWRENCCRLGLFFASKLQERAKPYIIFFYEALGDMEMEQLKDPATDSNNIAVPLMNEDHLEKAMSFYQEGGLIEKRNKAEHVFRENKKKVVIPHFKIEKKTDEQVVKYFENLAKELLEGKLSWLLVNLSCPVRFFFPSYEKMRERMPEKETTMEDLGFVNKVVDINGNSRKVGDDFELRQKYDIWLMNIIRNSVIKVILTAVKTKQLTYGKLKRWFLKKTCLGLPIEYPRSNQVVVASWYSQIDYGIEALLKQYNRFLLGKPTDWRIPVDLLSIRFEGVLRDMVGNYGGHVTKVGRDNNFSQVLLDSLLREPCLREIFREEDIEFFEYVFTAKGHNIRNNVAHAFFIPQDYGIIQATLVFLCILRLTMFSPKEVNHPSE